MSAPNQRQGCMTYTLTGGVLTVVAVCLSVITDGWFLYFLTAVGSLAAFFIFHYLLWGHLLTTQLQAEAERAFLQAADGDEGARANDELPLDDDKRRAIRKPPSDEE